LVSVSRLGRIGGAGLSSVGVARKGVYGLLCLQGVVGT